MANIEDLAQIKEFPDQIEIIKGEVCTLKTAELLVAERHFTDESFKHEPKAIYGIYRANAFYRGNLSKGQAVRTIKLSVEIRLNKKFKDEEKGKYVLSKLDAQMPCVGDVLPVFWYSYGILSKPFRGETYVNIAPDPSLDIGVALEIQQTLFRKPGQDYSDYMKKFKVGNLEHCPYIIVNSPLSLARLLSARGNV